METLVCILKELLGSWRHECILKGILKSLALNLCVSIS